MAGQGGGIIGTAADFIKSTGCNAETTTSHQTEHGHPMALDQNY